MKALYIASTGMAAQERNVEVISNNIANMRTTGFKRQRAEFQDLLYQAYRRAGSQHLGPGHDGAGRHRDRLGRQDRRDPAHHEPGQRGADRKGARRRRSAAKASSSCSCPTAAPPTPATARSSATAPGQLVNVDGYQIAARHHDPGRRQRASRSAADGMVEAFLDNDADADPARPDPARALRQQGRPRVAAATTSSSRPAPSGPAQIGAARHRRHGQPAAGLSRNGQRQRRHRDRRPDRRPARLRDERPRHLRRRRDDVRPRASCADGRTDR